MNVREVRRVVLSYLELSKGETAASTDLAVVLDGRASHDRAQLVDGARGESGSLGLTSGASRSLLPGLVQRVNIQRQMYIPASIAGLSGREMHT